MKKSFIFGVAALIAAGAVAVPTVENVALTYNPLTQGVTVTYDLTGEDGIVTVCFLTNEVPFEASQHVSGDVGKVVKCGTGKKIAWRTSADLGETNRTAYSLSARVTAWTKDSPPTYYVLNLLNGDKRFYEYEGQLPGGVDSDDYRTDKMVFRRIHAAGERFMMGAPSTETSAAKCTQDHHGYETLHNVTFTQDYYIGIFEVTQAQWLNIHGEIPDSSKYQDTKWQMPQNFTNAKGTLPVMNCARGRWLCGEQNPNPWDGNVTDTTHPSFFSHLRELAGTGSMYNLPTEAWWEYACRAGHDTALSDGRSYGAATDYSDIARYGKNENEGPLRVGSLKPNDWGLYDMHGNVVEICVDNVESRGKLKSAGVAETDAYYAKDRTDPHGLDDYNTYKIIAIRGGYWASPASDIRCAWRQANFDTTTKADRTGFRVTCPVDKY